MHNGFPRPGRGLEVPPGRLRLIISISVLRSNSWWEALVLPLVDHISPQQVAAPELEARGFLPDFSFCASIVFGIPT